jgi:inner membrane protein YidH
VSEGPGHAGGRDEKAGGDDPRPPDRLPGQAIRRRRPEERRGPGEVGEEPDPRFTFANERTFLAWNRTALALVAAGAAAAAFLKSNLSGARLLVALPLIVLGAFVGLHSFQRWEANERAMRQGDPLPYSGVPRLLAVTIVVVAAITAVFAVIDLVKD